MTAFFSLPPYNFPVLDHIMVPGSFSRVDHNLVAAGLVSLEFTDVSSVKRQSLALPEKFKAHMGVLS